MAQDIEVSTDQLNTPADPAQATPAMGDGTTPPKKPCGCGGDGQQGGGCGDRRGMIVMAAMAAIILILAGFLIFGK